MKIFRAVIFLLAYVLAAASGVGFAVNAQDGLDGSQGVLWFIQDSAYHSRENALQRMYVLKPQYEKVFLTEDEWADGYSDFATVHVSVHEEGGVYRL